MTVQEAKEQLLYDCHMLQTYLGIPHDLLEEFDYAIQALEEVEQYKAIGTPTQIYERIGGLNIELGKYACIGTVEELKETLEEALEKQILKKPTHKTESHPISPTTVNFETVYQCRNCHSIVKGEWNFCTLCGQAIDWEEGGTSD